MTEFADTTPMIEPTAYAHGQLIGAGMEQSHPEAMFNEIVRDMQLSPEAINDETNKALLGLVSEAWTETDNMPRQEAIKDREWLTETALRGLGWQSGFVHEHNLTEYQPNQKEVQAFGELFTTYSGSEQSSTLAAAIPGIIEDFGLAKKFNDVTKAKGLEFAVIPVEAAKASGVFNSSGAFVTLPDGKRGIAVRENTYKLAVEDGSTGSRALLAHEVGHTLEDVTIGKGDYPLGFLFNELLAEEASDGKTMYYDEKHMAGLLRATGLDLRGDVIPKLADGTMQVTDLIQQLKNQYGSRNTLRLLAYMPANYNLAGTEAPAVILEDCITYAQNHNGLTTAVMTERLATKYKPEIAQIVVTNEQIRAIVPPSLQPIMQDIAQGVEQRVD